MRIVTSLALALATLLGTVAAEAAAPTHVVNQAKAAFKSSPNVPAGEQNQNVKWSNGQLAKGTKGVYTGTLSTERTVTMPGMSRPGRPSGMQVEIGVRTTARVDTYHNKITIAPVARPRGL